MKNIKGGRMSDKEMYTMPNLYSANRNKPDMRSTSCSSNSIFQLIYCRKNSPHDTKYNMP
uniref:Uncharacterized protein n=1 Tax=Arion vulgaris TaxID=1028688 RepID=A0A0B7C277_9EUPU